MAVVRITPPGRGSRTYCIADVPRTWDLDGGCATASVPIVLSAEETERILFARVEVFGEQGMDWSGFVWRRPRQGEPIECAGQAVGLTLSPRSRAYASRSLSGFMDWRAAGDYNDGAFERRVSEGSLSVTQRPGTACASGDKAGLYLWGQTAWERMTATVNKPHPSMSLEIRSSATYTGTGSRQYISTAGSTGTTQIDISLDGLPKVMVIGIITASSTPSRSDTYVELSDITLYGTTLDPVTPLGVIEDCLDALPSWVLPSGDAYRAWLGDPAVTAGSLVFDDPGSTDKAKVDAVVAMTAHHFGFYPRRVGGLVCGVPVFAPIDTSPRYVIDARTAVRDDLRDRGADSLANVYRAVYRDIEGKTMSVDVTDADADNYLNVIGYAKTAMVDAQWTTDVAVATEAAEQAASTYSDTEGTLSVVKARTAAGRSCPASIIRPGDMCTVLGLGAPRDLVVRRVSLSAGVTSLTFSAAGTDLRYLTSKALGKSVVYY